MKWSEDWGSTTTWFAFAVLMASSFLLIKGLISADYWMAANGLSIVGVSGKGIAKVIKKNGAPAPAPPTP